MLQQTCLQLNSIFNLNILIGAITSGIFATILFFFGSRFFNYVWWTCKYSKYKGIYDVFEKREQRAEEDEWVEITKVRGLKLTIFRKHKERSDSFGEITMNNKQPNLGTGFYLHKKSKDGWGTLNIQMRSKDKSKEKEIFVNQFYQAKREAHWPAYIWIKKPERKSQRINN